MSQEPYVTNSELNDFARTLVAAQPRSAPDRRDELLFAAAYQAGQATTRRSVRRWQSVAGLLAIATTWLAVGVMPPPTRERQIGNQQVLPAPGLQQPAPALAAAKESILSTSPRWQLTDPATLAVPDQPALPEPAGASPIAALEMQRIWMVGSAARLALNSF